MATGSASHQRITDEDDLTSSLPLTEVGKALLEDARRSKAKEAKRRGKLANPSHVQRGLSFDQKAFIVEKLAVFVSPTQIIRDFSDTYGISLDARTLDAYNPSSRFCRIGQRLRSLYDQTRKAYIDRTAEVAVAHQAHRLRLIERTIDKALTSKEFNAVAKLLELAAKEMGGLTQTVEHKGVVAHVHGSVEDARAEVAMRLRALAESALPTVDATATLLPSPTDPPPPL